MQMITLQMIALQMIAPQKIALRSVKKQEKNMGFLFFRKDVSGDKSGRRASSMSYDKETMKPAIRCSICNGEQVAGFRNKQTGFFEEVALLRSPQDLEDFKKTYGITGEVEKFY